MNIIEASGNSLNLLGSAKLFIQLPHVLGNRIKLVEAVVLAGNTTDTELLISLDLLIAWDLIPPGFLNVTLTTYFNQLMKINQLKITTPVFILNSKKVMKKIGTKYQNPAKSAKS